MDKVIEYAKENGIYDEGVSDKELKALVESHSKAKYIAESFREGEEIDLDLCPECDIYYYGDSRCSCGNVRVAFVVEGSFDEGYYFYTEDC